MVDRTLQLVAAVLGWTILGLMIVLVLGSLVRRHPGSLDNLTAHEIKQAVDRS